MATANTTVTLCIFVGHLLRGPKENHAVSSRVDGVLADNGTGNCQGYKWRKLWGREEIIIQFRLSPLCISGQFGQTELLIYPEDGSSIFIRNVGDTAYLKHVIITHSHNRNHHYRHFSIAIESLCFNTLRTGSFKLFKRPFPGFLTILTL